MKRMISSFAAALAMVAVLGTGVACAQQTPPTLTKVTQTNLQTEVLQSTKPVFVVITAPNCATCATTVTKMAEQKAKHPGVNIVEVDAAMVGAPADQAPIVLVIVPEMGPTYQKAKFDPATVDAFMTKRVDVATKELAQVRVIQDVQKRIATASKPFDDQVAAIEENAGKAMQPLEQRAATVLKPFQDRATDITARRNTAVASLMQDLRNAKTEEDFNRIQTEINEKSKPFAAEMQTVRAERAEALKPLQEEAAKILKPFQDQATDVESKKAAALKDLTAEFEKAQSDLEKLTEQDVDAPAGK